MKLEKNEGSEEYKVKFWFKDPETGYSQQMEEMFRCESRSAHKRAEKFIKNLWLKKKIKIAIVSVIYQ